MKIRQWIAGTLLIALAGCVVAPMTRTYYEPNPADGKPIRSTSCGWNATALDALQRDLKEIAVSVFPKYEKGRPFRVHVLLGRTSSSMELDPRKLELRTSSENAKIPPDTTNAKAAGPYFSRSIDYTFPASFDADEIVVTFLPGFIKLDGKEIDISPFRFKRATKSDVYYGSINC
jgi:hypothetical protein